MQVNVSSLTVDECAQVLRINRHTLYRAIQRDEIPHIRIGNMIKIPVSFLGLEAPEVTTPTQSNVSRAGGNRWGEQMELFWLQPKRVWRNTGKPITPWIDCHPPKASWRRSLPPVSPVETPGEGLN